MKLTPQHARSIVDAYNLDILDESEVTYLMTNNPELYEAFKALVEFANTDDGEG